MIALLTCCHIKQSAAYGETIVLSVLISCALILDDYIFSGSSYREGIFCYQPHQFLWISSWRFSCDVFIEGSFQSVPWMNLVSGRLYMGGFLPPPPIWKMWPYCHALQTGPDINKESGFLWTVFCLLVHKTGSFEKLFIVAFLFVHFAPS